MLGNLILDLYALAYERLARPLIFRQSAQDAHRRAMSLLRWMDDQGSIVALLRLMHKLTFPAQPVQVGGVLLPHPLILAAGFVKGDGFATQEDASAAAASRSIIPGWRVMPALVGAAEFGSFTRAPRVGNSGEVLWRDAPALSSQNRMGLKNPGALAAAQFLAARREHLPAVYGINLAVSPGISDPDQELAELVQMARAFTSQRLRPSWYTLNLSCPNTKDDPGAFQTEQKARLLCEALADVLDAPLWVKISPQLSADQYGTLLRTFAGVGVRAVIATNTLPLPAPDASTAGVGGGRLHPDALEAVRHLTSAQQRRGYPVDVVACGGILDSITMRHFADMGVRAFQYWTAVIYRGPLAAAVILKESKSR